MTESTEQTTRQTELDTQLKLKIMADEFSLSKGCDAKESTDDWLITYADAITLLMAFFVLILSVSDINPSKFEAINNSLNKDLLHKEEVQNPLKDLEVVITEVLQEYQIDRQEALSLNDDFLKIELPGELLFTTGSAEPAEQSIQLLSSLAEKIKIFQSQNFNIEIEGHSDNVPIKSIRFPSNWELSSARAISILKIFMQQGVDKGKLKAIGYADTQPKRPNTTEDGQALPENQKLNRRVEIRVSRDFKKAPKT